MFPPFSLETDRDRIVGITGGFRTAGADWLPPLIFGSDHTQFVERPGRCSAFLVLSPSVWTQVHWRRNPMFAWRDLEWWPHGRFDDRSGRDRQPLELGRWLPVAEVFWRSQDSFRRAGSEQDLGGCYPAGGINQERSSSRGQG